MSRAFTNVTTGQNVLVTKQAGDVVVFTSGEGHRTTLVTADIPFAGGVIQVIDNLLIPPTRLEQTAQAFKLTSFLGALYSSDLMPLAADSPNFTIFAPSDVAMQLVAGTLSDLLTTPLSRVFGYHIVPGQVLSSALLTNGTVLPTLAYNTTDQPATNLHVRQAGNNLYVNSAQMLQPDILLANGILHVLGGVLNPEAAAASPDPELATQVPVFPVASASTLPFTTALPCTVDCPATASPSGASRNATTSTSLQTSTSEDAAPARATAALMPGAAALGMGMLGAGIGYAFAG
jgi:uncharacterized surface protein with fasciclin (FAS1) repeats